MLWDLRKDDVLYNFGSSNSFCLNSDHDTIFTINDKKQVLTWDLWTKKLIDASTPLPVTTAPNSFEYIETWSLFNPRTNRYPSGNPFRKDPSICIYLPFQSNPLYVHSLFPGDDLQVK